jgi:hypothetical protein
MTLLGAPFATERWSGNELVRNNGIWTATRVFDVTGTVTDAQSVLVTGLREGMPHPQNPALTLKSFDDKPRGPAMRVITAHYDMKQVDANSNPLYALPKILPEPALTNVAIDRDSLGNPITNSVGDPVNPKAQIDVPTMVLGYTRAEPFYNIATHFNFAGRCNSDTVTIPGYGTFQPGTLKMLTIAPIEEYFVNALFVWIKYRIEVNPGIAQDADGYWDGFKFIFQDVGSRAWYNNGTHLVLGNLVHDDGTEVQDTADVPLNGAGLPLPVNGNTAYYTVSGTNRAAPVAGSYMSLGTVAIDNTTNANAVMLKWRTLKSAAFSSLNF